MHWFCGPVFVEKRPSEPRCLGGWWSSSIISLSATGRVIPDQPRCRVSLANGQRLSPLVLLIAAPIVVATWKWHHHPNIHVQVALRYSICYCSSSISCHVRCGYVDSYERSDTRRSRLHQSGCRYPQPPRDPSWTSRQRFSLKHVLFCNAVVDAGEACGSRKYTHARPTKVMLARKYIIYVLAMAMKWTT